MSTPTAQFKCIKCGDKPESLEELRRHITVEHLRWIPFECLFCDVFKATELQLREHVQAKHPGKPFRLVLVSDPTNQQRLQQIIDQSTWSISHNQSSSSTAGSLVTVNVDEKRPSDESLSAFKRDSLTGASASLLNALATSKQQSPNLQQRPSTTIQRTPALALKSEILDASIEDHCFKTSVQTATSIQETVETVAENSTTVRRASKRKLATNMASAANSANRKRSRRQRSMNKKLPSQLNYEGTVTSHCRLCRERRSHQSPIEHIYCTHFEEDAIMCKFCSYTCRYNVSNMRSHIRRVHPDKPVDTGFEDKRQEFEPRVQQWIWRCFAKDSVESDVENTGGSPTDVPLVDAPSNPPSALQVESPEVSVTRTSIDDREEESEAESGVAELPVAAEPIPGEVANSTEMPPMLESGVDRSDSTNSPQGLLADSVVSQLVPEQPTESEAATTEKNLEVLTPNPKTGNVVTATAGVCNECGKNVSTKHRREHIFSNHLKLKTNLIHCNYCEHSVRQMREMKTHLSKFHASKEPTSGFDDRRGQFEGQYEEWKARCFPTISTPAAKTTGVKQKANFCQLCQRAVFERKQKHADRKHLQLPMLKCNFCEYTSPDCVSHMKRHLASRHPNETPTGFANRRAEFVDERRAMLQQCYGDQSVAD